MSRPTFLSKETALQRVRVRLDETVKRSVPCRLLFMILDAHRKNWALVGGAPRAWATEQPGDPGDLDIVIGGSQEDVDRIVAEWQARLELQSPTQIDRTRLGGYRMCAQDIVIDVWAAPSTVAIADGRLEDSKRFRAVAKSAALSLDSLVYTSKGTLYEHGFFKTFRTGILTLNHTRISRPKRMAEKAKRLCATYGLAADLALQGLIPS